MMMAQQISLFEEEPEQSSVKESIQDITWSHSRRSTLEQCTRRYYYDYFGANKRTAKQEAAKEILHFLKNRVQNRYLVAGSALHTVIKNYFVSAKKGNIWSADRLTGFGRKIFQDSWLYSRAHPDGKFTPAEVYPPPLLQEYYDENPEAEELCAAEEKRLIQALSNFATNDLYQSFRRAGTKPSAVIEEDIELTLFPCKVTGKIDLAYRDGDSVVVVDWKLGAEDGTGDDSLQLATYGLWAINYFKSTPDQLRVCKVHLSSNDVVDFRANAKVLAAARARIIQDAERMTALERYGEAAIAEAFTRCERPKICDRCVYGRVCYA